jgi:hypothetical protein
MRKRSNQEDRPQGNVPPRKRGAIAVDETGMARIWSSSEGRNPKDAAGMKQAWQVGMVWRKVDPKPRQDQQWPCAKQNQQ